MSVQSTPAAAWHGKTDVHIPGSDIVVDHDCDRFSSSSENGICYSFFHNVRCEKGMKESFHLTAKENSATQHHKMSFISRN
jgi:hypothetical protein